MTNDRLYVNGGGTPRLQPTVAVVRRRCPRCDKRRRVTITETADGWETWWCHTCGWRKRYRVR